jgi:membrane protein
VSNTPASVLAQFSGPKAGKTPEMATMSEVQRRGRDTVQIWIDAFDKHDLLTSASAIAFQVLKSLVPLALLGIALIGAVGRRDLWTGHLAPPIKSRVDPPVFHALDFAVKKIFAHNSGPLIAFATVLTVWYVSGGVRAIIGAINRIYDSEEDRPFWHRWALSIALAACVVAGMVGAALLVAAVPKPGGAWEIPAVAARWLGGIVGLALVTGILVRYGPVERRPKKWASTGAVLVVATWIVTTIIFRWYVSSLANFKTAIGQLAVFLVLMAYVYASSIVLLVGVQLDELLREDAKAEDRGILHVLFGIRH